MQTNKIKVVLVDDNSTFIRAAMLALSAVPEVQVVGAARSGATALSIMPLKHPELILMDLNMPDMDGITTALNMRAAGITARIVLVSLEDGTEDLAHKRGFVPDGFISKTKFADQIQPMVMRLFPQCTQDAGAVQS
jgi:two-component system nitrate/nitrite response regulator NarL